MGQASGGELVRLASRRSNQMLGAYRANMFRGRAEVRDMIIEDIRRFSELGASVYVDDLTEALFVFDEEGFMAPTQQAAATSPELLWS